MLELLLQVQSSSNSDQWDRDLSPPPAHVLFQPDAEPTTDFERIMRIRKLASNETLDLNSLLKLAETTSQKQLSTHWELLAPVVERLQNDLETKSGEIPFIPVYRIIYALRSNSIRADLDAIIKADDPLPLLTAVKEPTRLLLLIEGYRTEKKEDLLLRLAKKTGEANGEVRTNRYDEAIRLGETCYGLFAVQAAEDLLALEKAIAAGDTATIASKSTFLQTSLEKIKKDGTLTHIDDKTLTTGLLSVLELKLRKDREESKCGQTAESGDQQFALAARLLRGIISHIESTAAPETNPASRSCAPKESALHGLLSAHLKRAEELTLANTNQK